MWSYTSTFPASTHSVVLSYVQGLICLYFTGLAPLCTPRIRLEHNIRMDLKERGWEDTE